MTDKQKSKKSPKSKAEKNSDLMKISGIKEVTAGNLNKHCRIHTLQDLANSSVDKIEVCLKQAGQRGVSRNKIKKWIADAKKLIAAKKNKANEEAISAPEKNDESSKKERKAKVKNPSDKRNQREQWNLIGAFIVDFWEREKEDQSTERQITIDQREVTNGQWSDKQKSSDVVEGKQLYQWMAKKIGPEMWPTSESKPTPTAAQPTEAPQTEQVEETAVIEKTATKKPVDVKITQVTISQPANDEKPILISNDPLKKPPTIKAKSPITFDVSFQLIAPDKHAQQIIFNSQYYLQNKTTKEKIYLGRSKSEALTPGQKKYTATLENATIQPGEYLLHILVMVRHMPPSADHFRMPSFQIVA